MKKEKNKSFIIIVILFIVALTFMTVGFAVYNRALNINGSATVKPDGKIYIKSVVATNTTASATVNPSPVFTDDEITDFHLSFTTDGDLTTQYSAEFQITIANESSYDFIYNVPEYVLTVEKNGVTYYNLLTVSITGISKGEAIASNTEKVITATIEFTDPDIDVTGTYEVNGVFTPDLKEDTVGRLIGEVNENTVGDLTGSNQSAAFTINVTSTYNEAKTFTLTVADTNKYIVVDSNGQPNQQFTISANNPGQDFTFYLRKATGTFEYNSEIEKVKILIVPTGESGSNAGRVTVRVDTNGPADTVAPYISNVSVAYVNNTNNQLAVSWDSRDNGTIDYYTIIPYKKNSNGTYSSSPSVTTSNKNYTFTSLNDGTYYFVVYGKDTDGNTATALDIQRANTSEGHASKNADFDAQWTFTIRFVVTEGSLNKANNSTETVYRYTNYSTSLYATQNNYTCQIASVTMGGANKAYSYNNNTLAINRPITGDIIVTASATRNSGSDICLVEGTKILVANGKYKNIEDITYTDLLTVYDHVNGGVTNVYPIWIEKKTKGESYIKISFDDGTDIKIYQRHCLFDADRREYVDTSRGDQFNAGSRVYKVIDGKLKIVTVTNIEHIQKEIYYYNVMSTSYYNVIADDLITTDNFSQNVNYLYMFDDNAIYKRWDEICAGPQLEAKDFNMPEYIFKGANLRNTAVTQGKYTDVNEIAASIAPRTLMPIMKMGKPYFMMTTSLDNVNKYNVNKFLHREGSYYKLPEGDVSYYIETSTNTRYNPGDIVEAEYSKHFKAVK